MTQTVQIDGQNVHYYQGGKGPVFLLLHASPLSHQAFTEWFPALEDHFTVIALDTPGQGKSQPFALDTDEMPPFTALLARFIDLLDIEQCFIYGSATGAQWGISYAKEHPSKVTHLFLDNAAHFEDELREKIMADYFPDITPKEDGAHLRATWHMVGQLFTYFPWCYAEEQYKLSTPQPPSSVTHEFSLNYMRCSASWDKAYRAAFKHEKAAYVNQLQVPTTLFRYAGSIILPFINDLVSRLDNGQVKVLEIEANPSERPKIMLTHFTTTKDQTSSPGYIPSKDIETVQIDSFRLPDFPCAPDVSDDGAHLDEAWSYLSKYFPDTSIATRHRYLIEWLS